MTPAPAVELNDQFQFRLIPIDLIDEPRKPERETMDPEALADLAASIASVGLIKPLIVLPRGKRFETDAGHRRLLACRLCSYTPVPCRVKVNDHVSALSIMVHENAHTEPVNAIEEARFYAEYLTVECFDDVDILCQKLRRRREFVEGRLNLLVGHPRVIRALSDSRISIGAAEQLNRVQDPNRLLLLLDQAINQGATSRTIAGWVREANTQEPIILPPDAPFDPNAPAVPPNTAGLPTCFFCRSSKHPHQMRFHYIHEPCADIMRDALNLPDPAAPGLPI